MIKIICAASGAVMIASLIFVFYVFLHDPIPIASQGYDESSESEKKILMAAHHEAKRKERAGLIVSGIGGILFITFGFIVFVNRNSSVKNSGRNGPAV